MLKRVLIIIGLLLVAAGLVLYTPDKDVEDLRSKYANDASEFLTVNIGLTLHYRDEGLRDGPILVLLHGNSSSLHTFDPLVERLKDRYRLIRYDHPGHGLTGPNATQTYAYADYAVALDALVATLDLQQFHLLGHSMGGWIAWRYTLENPTRVTSLVLASASGMPLEVPAGKVDTGLGFRLARSSVGQFIGRHVTPRSMVRDSAEASVADESLVTEEWVDRYYELLLRPGNREAFFARAIADREPHLAGEVSAISVPTLLLWGREDSFIPATAAEVFAARMPNTRTVILDNIGHMPFREAPDATAKLVKDHLCALEPDCER